MDSTGIVLYVVVLAVCLVAVLRYRITVWSTTGMLLVASLAMFVAGINALQTPRMLWIGMTLIVVGTLLAGTFWRRRARTS